MARRITHPPRSDIRIMDPEFHRNPFTAYAWMREHAPVYYDAEAPVYGGRGAWGIASYRAIRFVATHHEQFISGRGSRPDAPPVPSMINQDAPEHLARRSINRRRFTPHAVRRYEDYVREVAVELIEAVRHQGHCDLVADLAMPLPMRVIGHMMQLPEADYARLLKWSDLIATGLSNMPAEFEREVLAAAAEFEHYITDWFQQRSEAPGEDILSAIVRAKVLGRPLGHKDKVHEALLLLVGGDETTRHVITGGVAALLDNPEQLEALGRDPGLMSTAVEEMLRWVTPVKTLAREVVEDIELEGQGLAAGDRVIMLFESGNRDAAQFNQADEFDITRDPNRHLSFGGYGRHHCLGAHLARLEIRVMLEELLSRLPGLRRAQDGGASRRYGTFVLGYESFPVQF